MLRTKFFGIPEVTLNAQSLGQALTGRRLALFAYLLSQEYPLPRSVLSDLLWVDLPEAQARENLRSLLSHTRRVVGDYVVADRQAVTFNRAAPYWADVEAFSSFFVTGPTIADLPLLLKSLQLYRGEFLAGFYIQGAPVFEGWLLEQRQQWHTQAVQGWQQLAHYHFTRGDDAAGLVANERLLALEPWHEEAHRRQMVMLARSGRHDAALAYFDHCCAILREEVDAPPDEETVALYEQIKVGVLSPNGLHNPHLAPVTVAPITVTHNVRTQFEPQAPTQHKATNGYPVVVPPLMAPAPSPIAIDWGAMPHEPRFHGRQAELRQLQQWCVHERRRVVAVFGVGGQGKTALAVRFIRTLAEASQAEPQAAPAFERVIWRSLLAVPPLTDILQDWLQQLSDQQVVTRPPTLDQQLTLLHDYLQRRRFLLVLDNVESILLDDGSGACRSGYEPYEQLWQLFAQRDHQCCLLLTSRERPRVFSSHEEQVGALRTLLLDGLALADGQQLLRTHRVVGEEATMRALLGCYSGNPLALKLVADTIDELFAGNVAAFLQEETPFFADIGAVLDQQFARVSPLEVELLTWLALEQEPVTSQTLWENLVAPPAKRDFLTALHTLVRRSFVQTQGELFSLQNVILEYTRNRLVHLIGEELTNDKMTRWQEDTSKAEASHLVTLSSHHPLLQSAFNRYALLKAQAKAYVRASQQRLVLEPLVRRLQTYWGRTGAETLYQRLLTELRQVSQTPTPLSAGYAASNILHLLLRMNVKLGSYDFSQLTLRQAHLRSEIIQDVNFKNATMQSCTFTDNFLAVTALAFHPLSRLLIAGGLNGAVAAWEVTSGVLSALLPNHGQTIFYVGFSHDGATLVTAGIDQRICVWNWSTHELRYALLETSNFVRSVVFSPDDRWLIVAGGDGAIKFYVAATGQLYRTLTTPSNWLWSITLNSNGTKIAAGAVEGVIYLWTLNQQMEPIGAMRMLPGHQDTTCAILFSHDEYYLYSAGHDNLIHIWQLADDGATSVVSSQPWRTLRGHTNQVRTLALSPNGHYLASGSSDTTVRLWDVRTGELVDTLVGHEQLVWSVAFQPNPTSEQVIWVSSGSDQRIFVWEAPTQADSSCGRLCHILQGYADSVRTVQFHPNGSTLLSCGFDKLVRIWDVQTGRLRQTLPGAQNWLMPLAIDATGNYTAASGHDRTILLWRAAQAPNDQTSLYEAQPRIIPTGHVTVVLGLAFSPTGKIVATSSQDQTIRLWKIEDGLTDNSLLQILTGHSSLVWSIAFSPDGRWLASGSFDRTIRLWDVSRLQANLTAPVETVSILTGHTGPVWSVAFTPDGEQLVSGSSDHTVRIWRIGQPHSRVLRGHTNLVRAVAVSPQSVDGKFTLASCDDDGCIRIWDAIQGNTIHELCTQESFIHSLAYSPDGSMLASGSEQGAIRLWDVQSGAHLQTLHIPRPYSGMNITGVTGITPAQKAALLALGAVEE
ncbi:MAG: BTAD domain-containing putative transcriptional regulator [Caldilineaceae bacterium]